MLFPVYTTSQPVLVVEARSLLQTDSDRQGMNIEQVIRTNNVKYILESSNTYTHAQRREPLDPLAPGHS